MILYVEIKLGLKQNIQYSQKESTISLVQAING